MPDINTPVLYTIGYGNKGIGHFIDRLVSNEITMVYDVRLVPRSRDHDFNGYVLAHILDAYGIGYYHAKSAGNKYYKSPRPLEDYQKWLLGTDEGRDMSITLGDRIFIDDNDYRVALMCSEYDPLMCHRSILAHAITSCLCRIIHI